MTHAAAGNPYDPPGAAHVPQNSSSSMPSQFAALAEIDGIEINGRTKYRVSPEMILMFWQTGLFTNMHEAFLIPDVVMSPLGAWQDLKRQDVAESICIAGYPNGQFALAHKLHSVVTLQQDRVFLVFATADLLISKWRWENVDSDGSGFPTSHNTRFGRQIWPR